MLVSRDELLVDGHGQWMGNDEVEKENISVIFKRLRNAHEDAMLVNALRHLLRFSQVPAVCRRIKLE